MFTSRMLPSLREAVADFSLLLTKGYADRSALKLVGDRFSLTQRQRLAVMRSACSDQHLHARLARRVPVEALARASLAIDGYNLLITIEAALSGGFIFKGRDGCFRDLASIHGTYRKVEETIPAVELIGDFLADIRTADTRAESVPRAEGVPPSNRGQDARDTTTRQARAEGVLPSNRGQDARDTTTRQARAEGVLPSDRGQNPAPAKAGDARDTAGVLWLLDSPVSNSGRLKTLIARIAGERHWPWEIRLTLSPDAELSKTDAIVVSTDSVILDAGPRWTNLAAEIITRRLPLTTVIDIAPDSA